jgi:putative FmdB family regulatory protein
MPIYAYKCGSCGHAKDVLQKISDAPLTVCPACGAASFSKQVTAAGFQLKGSGWYVTDFRGGNTGAAADKPADKAADGAKAEPGKAEPAKTEPAKTESAKTETAPAPAPAKTDTPSASAGASSASH